MAGPIATYVREVFKQSASDSWRAAQGWQTAVGAAVLWAVRYLGFDILAIVNANIPRGGDDPYVRELAAFVIYLVVAFVAIFILRLIFISPAKVFARQFNNLSSAINTIGEHLEENAGLRRRIDELSRPYFVIEIGSVHVGVRDNRVAHVTLHVTAQNRGSRAALVELTWRLRMYVGDREVKLTPFTIPNKWDVPSPPHFYRYVRGDGIDSRASKPIPRNGYVAGVLVFMANLEMTVAGCRLMQRSTG